MLDLEPDANYNVNLCYKFLPLDSALRVLESKKLKVSQLTELNDIFDCSPVIAAPLDEPNYNDQQWTEHIIKQNSKGYGVVCFSKSYRSPLLWGHYAGSATGLALGFDMTEIPWGSNPMDIRYDNARPQFDWAAESAINNNFVEHMLRCSFGVKASEWAYEQETRFILGLDNCPVASGMYFAPFAPSSLKEIILGPRSNLDHLYLLRFLQQQYKDYEIKVRHARPHSTQFEIELFDPPLA